MADDYLGAEQAMVTKWVIDRLKGAPYTASFEAVVAGLGTRIYEDLAPEGTTYPFIVVQCQSPPRDIRGVGETRVMVDTLFLVKAVSQGTSYDPLTPIVKVIDTAMTSPQGGTVGADGLVFTSIREDQFSLTTVEAGTQFRHLGGEYRIQAQA